MTKQQARDTIYQAAELRRLQGELQRRRTNWEFAGIWLTVGSVAGLVAGWVLRGM